MMVSSKEVLVISHDVAAKHLIDTREFVNEIVLSAALAPVTFP